MKQKCAKPKMFLPSPTNPPGEGISGAVFGKCTQGMLFDVIDPSDTQFNGTTKDYSKKELCVFLQLLFPLEENCRILHVA